MANNVFVDVERIPFVPEQAAGLGISNVGAMQMGEGSKVFRGDKRGIWLGAKVFADAPFSVDMEGNLVASSATLTGFSKIYIWKQDAIPTSVSIGDLWTDTNDSNKVYRAAMVGADQITAGEWEEVTTDSILRTVANQTLTGSFNLNDGNVLIDGVNKRILINDGTNNRIVIGTV